MKISIWRNCALPFISITNFLVHNFHKVMTRLRKLIKSYGSEKGDCFHPFSEIISSGDYPLVSFRRERGDKNNKVKPPIGERPWWRNRL